MQKKKGKKIVQHGDIAVGHGMLTCNYYLIHLLKDILK